MDDHHCAIWMRSLRKAYPSAFLGAVDHVSTQFNSVVVVVLDVTDRADNSLPRYWGWRARQLQQVLRTATTGVENKDLLTSSSPSMASKASSSSTPTLFDARYTQAWVTTNTLSASLSHLISILVMYCQHPPRRTIAQASH
jgi:hypothetical protein